LHFGFQGPIKGRSCLLYGGTVFTVTFYCALWLSAYFSIILTQNYYSQRRHVMQGKLSHFYVNYTCKCGQEFHYTNTIARPPYDYRGINFNVKFCLHLFIIYIIYSTEVVLHFDIIIILKSYLKNYTEVTKRNF